MKLIFPNSERVNRGAHIVHEIVDAARSSDVTDILIFHEHRGEPGKKKTTIFQKNSFFFVLVQRKNSILNSTKLLLLLCLDGLIISHMPYGPTAYFGLSNCVLRHDIQEKETVSLVYPHLLFHNFNTTLGQRTMNVLKYLFPVPKEDSKRVITFANQNDYISFR
jgi:U3 small nucleolar ribonucleoprotein protein IMP4